MPSHSHVLHACSAEEFCDALRELREHQQITLDAIAEATKIPAYLFEGLEHHDLRRWPHGLFRRSFFRDYARAIGLPVAEACSEFLRWFPEAEPAITPEVATLTKEEPAPRLMQALASLGERWKRVASELSNVAKRLKPEPPEPEVVPERKWVSDARRVGPRPKIRVRIKVPR